MTACLAAPLAAQVPGNDNAPLSVDHYVAHVSTVPAIAGQTVQLYVRERVQSATAQRRTNLEGRVVLFVHGAGTPAEVAFDVPHGSYSWMAHLAAAGFDVFAMDVTGYGRSTRPHSMNDPCNLAAEQRASFDPLLAAADCRPTHSSPTGTMQSDWDDIAAVLDYIGTLRGVGRVHLIGWSLGGPRAGGFAVHHPDRVGRVVLLAPAYARDGAGAAPAPETGPPMTAQSRDDFISNWDRQVGCEDQYDPQVAATVWREMLASDPVGATWGPGIRRAPTTTVWGFNRDAVANFSRPLLIVQGIHDAQIVPERAEALHADAGTGSKLLVDLGCASHNAMWERNHLLLFEASLEWLRDGTVRGMSGGIVRLGY